MFVRDFEKINEFFSGSGGTNILCSPSFLMEHNGSPRISLVNHEVIHGGRDVDKKVVYTTLRILGKESEDNTIQGILKVNFVDGYAVTHHSMEIGKDYYMRPNDIRKVVTIGTTSIKRNSVIVLNKGMVIRLDDVEDFCDLPVISKNILIKSQSSAAINKRDAYKESKGEQSWAHVKKGALLKDQEKSVHNMMLPYFRQFRKNSDKSYYFKVFMDDMLKTCNAFHTKFLVEDSFDTIVGDVIQKNKKRAAPSLETESNPRKKWGGSVQKKKDGDKEDIVQQVLKKINKSSISSLIF